jgi:hypothetical protein
VAGTARGVHGSGVHDPERVPVVDQVPVLVPVAVARERERHRLAKARRRDLAQARVKGGQQTLVFLEVGAVGRAVPEEIGEHVRCIDSVGRRWPS